MKNWFTKNNIRWAVFTVLVYALFQYLISVNIINSYYQVVLYNIGINIVLALGLNLIIGYSGQFSLGHAGFMAIGLVMLKVDGTVGFLAGIGFGIVMTALIALIIAIPTLRLRGDYLAIATLGFSEVIRIAITNMDDITGGAAGLNNIPKITNFNWIFGVIVISLVLIVNFARSSHGRATASVREDEIAAESMGVNTTKYKTLAFVIGACLASVGGALYAGNFYTLTPGIFGFMKSVDILVIVVFGGMGSLSGSIVAAFLLGLINMFLNDYAELRMIIYSVLIIVIMVYRPNGLFGNKELNINAIFKRKGGKRS